MGDHDEAEDVRLDHGGDDAVQTLLPERCRGAESEAGVVCLIEFNESCSAPRVVCGTRSFDWMKRTDEDIKRLP